jgi:hypothetical protein
MCLGGPRIISEPAPDVPARQPSRSPYGAGGLDAAAAAQAALRRRMGLAATILTSPLGVAMPGPTAAKTLLGG